MKSTANGKSRITKLLTNRTEHTLIQLFRYTFVGGMAWLVDMSSLYALTEYTHIHYFFSAAIAAEYDVVVI